MSQTSKKTPTVIQGGAGKQPSTPATKSKKKPTPVVMGEAFIRQMTNGFVVDCADDQKTKLEKKQFVDLYKGQLKSYATSSREGMHSAIAATYVMISALGKDEGEVRFPDKKNKGEVYNWRREVVIATFGYARREGKGRISKLLSAFNKFDKMWCDDNGNLADRTKYPTVFKFLKKAGGVEKLLYTSSTSSKGSEEDGRAYYDDLLEEIDNGNADALGDFTFDVTAEDPVVLTGEDDYVLFLGRVDDGEVRILEEVRNFNDEGLNVATTRHFEAKAAWLDQNAEEDLTPEVEYWLNVSKFTPFLGKKRRITVSPDGTTTTISNETVTGGYGPVVQVKSAKDWFGAGQMLVLDDAGLKDLRDKINSRANRDGLAITGQATKTGATLDVGGKSIKLDAVGNKHIEQIYVADGLTAKTSFVFPADEILKWHGHITTEHAKIMKDATAKIAYTNKTNTPIRRVTTINIGGANNDELEIISPLLTPYKVKLPTPASASYKGTFNTEQLRKVANVLKERKMDGVEVSLYDKLVTFFHQTVWLSLPQYVGNRYSDGNLISE